MTRRGFVGWTMAAAVGQAMSQWLGFGEAQAAGGPPPAEGPIPRRPLGRTGESVTVLGLGGSHIGRQADPAESVRIIRGAVDGGITFLDNSWDYNGGESERRMGRALKDGYRERVCLMTKFDGRDQKSAARQIDESLRRLQTDHVDLLQFHEIIRPSDPERIFAAHGAIEAALAARKAGKARFLGFTGHKSPDLHLAMLKACEAHGFHPDTVQLPLNVMDASYESFEARVLPELTRRGIGVLGMKPLGDGELLRSHAVAPEDGLRYAMSVPGVSVTITGVDSMEILAQALAIARGFEPLDVRRRTALREAAAAAAANGQYELYKTSHHFDSTHQHPEWLG
ncbi:aldo/keto reductase [Anaeromyxobacter paludicola]|uniref:Oxidoreductase n=1 Tax=Anaeromyxobacter paludicola TaxID=2918171 RepID=A0ABN6N5S6_9BACT|nr:aldo/keto reductase [Anaeromyxobacter paludicola]BDG08537.1 oxidoreductase [Anaeromyxobacter paludicola]